MEEGFDEAHVGDQEIDELDFADLGSHIDKVLCFDAAGPQAAA